MSFPVKAVVPVELTRCDVAESFLQSGFWGSFKARFGWNARAFMVDWEGGGSTPLLTIRRRLGPLGAFAYVPWGPELPPSFPDEPLMRSRAMLAIAELLQDQLPHDTAFIRFDPPWLSLGAELAPALSEPFHRASADIQPPDSVEIDLSGGEASVLAGMKPKWRYNIRLAERKGVLVSRKDEDGLDAFYELLQETSRRDGIAVHGPSYYRSLFTHQAEYSGSSPDLRLYTAEFEGRVVAGVILLFRGQKATYLYGASASSGRTAMPAYALQWTAMREAIASGCVVYDLFGIPPNQDPSHPMAGLYRFKTGFGGRVVHRPGSWDYSYHRGRHLLFNLAEGTRKSIRSMRKSRLRARGGAQEGREANS